MNSTTHCRIEQGCCQSAMDHADRIVVILRRLNGKHRVSFTQLTILKFINAASGGGGNFSFTIFCKNSRPDNVRPASASGRGSSQVIVRVRFESLSVMRGIDTEPGCEFASLDLFPPSPLLCL